MLPIIIFMLLVCLVSGEYDRKQCFCTTTFDNSLTIGCPADIAIISKEAISNCSDEPTKVVKLKIVINQRRTDIMVQLDNDIFTDFPNVTHLNLSDIGLIRLKPGILSPLSKLSKIDLSHNKLQFIPADIFYHYVLRDVDLNYNDIKYLNSFPEYNTSILTQPKLLVRIFNNPVQCHCINELFIATVKRFTLLTEFKKICFENNSTQISCAQDDLIVSTSHNFTGIFYYDVLINCHVFGPKPYSVVWQSPNGTFYAHQTYEPWVHRHLIANRSLQIEPRDFHSYISVLSNHSIIIKHYRGFFYGEWKCLAFVPNGRNYSSTLFLSIRSMIPSSYISSLLSGATVSGSLLLVGIIVGFIHLCRDTKCFTEDRKSTSFKRPFFEVIPVPSEAKSKKSRTTPPADEYYEPVPVDDGDNLDEVDDLNADVELVFKDEDMAREYMQAFDTLSQCANNPSAFRTHLEDIRSRLRRDVGPKLKIVRSRVRRATEDSRNRMHRHMEILRNFNQESRDRMQRSMDVLKANRSEAANRVRASLEHVKEHMKSVAELCGTVHLGQTISLISVNTNESQPIKEYYFE